MSTTNRFTGTLFDLSGRTALVTGGSRGIGQAISERLAQHGANVVIAGRKLDLAQALASSGPYAIEAGSNS